MSFGQDQQHKAEGRQRGERHRHGGLQPPALPDDHHLAGAIGDPGRSKGEGSEGDKEQDETDHGSFPEMAASAC